MPSSRIALVPNNSLLKDHRVVAGTLKQLSRPLNGPSHATSVTTNGRIVDPITNITVPAQAARDNGNPTSKIGEAIKGTSLNPPMHGFLVVPGGRMPPPQAPSKQIITFSSNGRAVTQAPSVGNKLYHHMHTGTVNPTAMPYFVPGDCYTHTDSNPTNIAIVRQQISPPSAAMPMMPTNTAQSTQWLHPGARSIPNTSSYTQQRPAVAQVTNPGKAPHAAAKLKSKSIEQNIAFQPISNATEDYYLHDDYVLVEEDMLPARPSGRYTQARIKKTSLPTDSSLMIHPIPPRMIGGLQDQVHTMKVSCNCREIKRRSKRSSHRGEAGTSCLKLYCDCFATGFYCNEHCTCSASCFNNAAEANVQPRTHAIVEALKNDPHAFRHVHTVIAQRQKEHRILLAKAEAHAIKKQRLQPLPTISRSVSKSSPNSVENINTIEQALNFVTLPQFEQASNDSFIADCDSDDEDPSAIPPTALLTTQLPPSYYTAPVKINDGSTILTGLSFSLTHPRNRVKKPKQLKTNPYHELMLPPSQNGHKSSEANHEATSAASVIDISIATSDAGPAPKKQRIGETEREAFWQGETQKVAVYFQAMRTRMDPSKKPYSWFPFEETKEQAEANFRLVKDDIQSIKTVVAAAKIDIMARFYQENRLKRGQVLEVDHEVVVPEIHGNFGHSHQDDESYRLLKCDEQLESTQQQQKQHVPENNDSTLKALTIIASQDTALLQETSRIIRRMARELCERRMRKTKS